METLRTRYLKAGKTEKGNILNEYCRNTGEDRKYAIKKFRGKVAVKTARKTRTQYYGSDVTAALAKMWRIFDHPCGQRLESILRTETDKVRILGELVCSQETAIKLKKITSSTIDKKLEHEKEMERRKRMYKPTHTFPLKREVPVKTAAEQDRENPGVEQIDFVEHCGSSASGEYVNSLSVVDIFSGWWEGDAVMGKGQRRALAAINEARERCPFVWREMHPDNGSNLMNYHILKYAEREHIELTRSRPYKKNDNCFVEQKNSTHIRRGIGYLRYDTEAQRVIISDLYRNELRLYKNFFQPVIKLVSKTRVKGRIKKKYDTPKTPYARLVESDRVSTEQKREMKCVYESLNPAQIKRMIDQKLKRLQHEYDNAKGVQEGVSRKKTQKPLVSSLIIQRERVGCHT